MKILFIHQNFPGQFKHLAPTLAAQGHQVVALGLNEDRKTRGVRYLRYKIKRGSTPNIHPWVGDFETKVLRAEACARACQQLRDQGFTPDIVYAHPGWGESLFVKDVWPQVPLLHFFEFYYRAQGGDASFDPEFPRPPMDEMRVRAKNAANLLALEACDAGLCPTEWQKSVHPPEFLDKIEVIFDGVDTTALKPDVTTTFTVPGGPVLSRKDEIITFVNRNLEPYRGWHVFARMLPELLRRRPNARVLITGGDEVSYGAKPKQGGSWRQIFWNEVSAQVDQSRVHFLGKLPYTQFLRMLQVSTAHVYLTYPFVLSWSVLEAMSLEGLVIGSRTPPVEEVIRHGENGLLVDFFDRPGFLDALDFALDNPERMRPLREAARRTVVERYDLKSICLPRQLALLDRLTHGGLSRKG